MSSEESDESDKEESDKPGSESGSDGTFSTGLCGLLRGVVFPIGVTIYNDESCDSEERSLAVPRVNFFHGAVTREGVCTRCTVNA